MAGRNARLVAMLAIGLMTALSAALIAAGWKHLGEMDGGVFIATFGGVAGLSITLIKLFDADRP
jgi:hypothetical protein